VIGALIYLETRNLSAASRAVSAALIVGGGIQSWSDIETRTVRRVITCAMGVFVGAMYIHSGQLISIETTVAIAVGLVFWAIHHVRQMALGFGDVLLSPVLTLCVAWFDVQTVPVWLFLASLGAVATAAIHRQNHVAFVPWLVGSAIVVVMITSNTRMGLM
jgi:prepilin signal peptidase PulO-like enzyme (type II secretory pathway)